MEEQDFLNNLREKIADIILTGMELDNITPEIRSKAWRCAGDIIKITKLIKKEIASESISKIQQ